MLLPLMGLKFEEKIESRHMEMVPSLTSTEVEIANKEKRKGSPPLYPKRSPGSESPPQAKVLVVDDRSSRMEESKLRVGNTPKHKVPVAKIWKPVSCSGS